MKLWRDNKIDQEWELPEREIAERFFGSPYADEPVPLDRALRLFIAAPDGLSSVWVDDAAYDRILDIVVTRYTGGGARP